MKAVLSRMDVVDAKSDEMNGIARPREVKERLRMALNHMPSRGVRWIGRRIWALYHRQALFRFWSISIDAGVKLRRFVHTWSSKFDEFDWVTHTWNEKIRIRSGKSDRESAFGNKDGFRASSSRRLASLKTSWKWLCMPTAVTKVVEQPWTSKSDLPLQVFSKSVLWTREILKGGTLEASAANSSTVGELLLVGGH